MSGTTIHLRDNTTGEIRLIEEEYWDDESSEYLWTEGNYGCDCNRALFFARSVGEPDPEHICGTTRYTALKAVLWSGEEVELDDLSDDAGKGGS